MKKWIGSVNESLSQVLNAILGGYPDEMLSARAWRDQSWFRPWVDKLFGENHCRDMYDYEWTRKSQHPHYHRD